MRSSAPVAQSLSRVRPFGRRPDLCWVFQRISPYKLDNISIIHHHFPAVRTLQCSSMHHDGIEAFQRTGMAADRVVRQMVRGRHQRDANPVAGPVAAISWVIGAPSGFSYEFLQHCYQNSIRTMGFTYDGPRKANSAASSLLFNNERKIRRAAVGHGRRQASWHDGRLPAHAASSAGAGPRLRRGADAGVIRPSCALRGAPNAPGHRGADPRFRRNAHSSCDRQRDWSCRSRAHSAVR